MDHFRKTLGQVAVAAGVATALLTYTLVSPRPTEAGPPPQQQETAKEQVKVEVKKQEAPAQPKAASKTVIVVPGVPMAPMIRMEAVKAVPLGGRVVAPDALAPAVQLANMEAMTKQMVQQLRPIFRAELFFLTSAAGPSASQRREIAIEGGLKLKETAAKLAEVQQGFNQGRRIMTTMPEPRKIIREAFTAAAKARLSPEQFDRLQKEIVRREEDLKEALLLNIVANLDKLLILGAEQRDRLSDSLLSHWDERIYPPIDLLLSYEAYFPTIPDQYITPILNEDQRKIWRAAQKLNFTSIRNNNFFFNNGQMNNLPGNVEDEDEKAALAEEPKK